MSLTGMLQKKQTSKKRIRKRRLALHEMVQIWRRSCWSMMISSTFSLDSHGLRFIADVKILENDLPGRQKRRQSEERTQEVFQNLAWQHGYTMLLYRYTQRQLQNSLQCDQVIKIDRKTTTSKHSAGTLKSQQLIYAIHKLRLYPWIIAGLSFCKKRLSVRENAKSSRTRKGTRCSLKLWKTLSVMLAGTWVVECRSDRSATLAKVWMRSKLKSPTIEE